MKSNTKKRLIAFMLCMVLVLSSATSAFADEQQDMDSTNQIETTAELLMRTVLLLELQQRILKTS